MPHEVRMCPVCGKRTQNLLRTIRLLESEEDLQTRLVTFATCMRCGSKRDLYSDPEPNLRQRVRAARGKEMVERAQP